MSFPFEFNFLCDGLFSKWPDCVCGNGHHVEVESLSFTFSTFIILTLASLEVRSTCTPACLGSKWFQAKSPHNYYTIDIFVYFCCQYKVLTMMEKVVQETISYTRQRKIFQEPVLYHQVVHFRLAELQTEIELLRSLLYRCTGEPTHQPDNLKQLQWETPCCVFSCSIPKAASQWMMIPLTLFENAKMKQILQKS